jgi:hypothetical protein
MNTFKRKCLFPAMLAIIAALAVLIPTPIAVAATPNYPPAYSVTPIVLHVSGQYTATTTAVARFNVPFRCKLIGVGASARASGGTSPTLTVDVKAAGTTVLSAPITVTAATYTEGTITTSAIADEAAITVDFTIGGTSPTWNDMVVVLTVVRL